MNKLKLEHADMPCLACTLYILVFPGRYECPKASIPPFGELPLSFGIVRTTLLTHCHNQPYLAGMPNSLVLVPCFLERAWGLALYCNNSTLHMASGEAPIGMLVDVLLMKPHS